MPLVFRGVVGPAVADAVAFFERAVQEDEVWVVCAQRHQQARRLLGEQTGDLGDVGVGGAHGYPKARGDTGKGVVATQVHERDQRTAVRREFAPPVTLTGDDEHRDPLDQRMGQVECGRIRNQQGSCAAESRRRTPPSTAREPCPLCTPTSHRPVTRSVGPLKTLSVSGRPPGGKTASLVPTPDCRPHLLSRDVQSSGLSFGLIQPRPSPSANRPATAFAPGQDTLGPPRTS